MLTHNQPEKMFLLDIYERAKSYYNSKPSFRLYEMVSKVAHDFVGISTPKSLNDQQKLVMKGLVSRTVILYQSHHMLIDYASSNKNFLREDLKRLSINIFKLLGKAKFNSKQLTLRDRQISYRITEFEKQLKLDICVVHQIIPNICGQVVYQNLRDEGIAQIVLNAIKEHQPRLSFNRRCKLDGELSRIFIGLFSQNQ